MSYERIEVECHSGYRANERPLAFFYLLVLLPVLIVPLFPRQIFGTEKTAADEEELPAAQSQDA